MKKIYPIFPAGIRVCFDGAITEIEGSREKAFALVSRLGERAYVEFYDEDGVFDRISYDDVLMIAITQTPEIVKTQLKNTSDNRFCISCKKAKPGKYFFENKCGDCNNIVFLKY